MSEHIKDQAFTVCFEGLDARNGNVGLDSFLVKIHQIKVLLSKMERAYNNSRDVRTSFEIVDVEKKNPTKIFLSPSPKVKNYNPHRAFEWGMQQIQTVANGKIVDDRITEDIKISFIRVATPENGYKNCYLNGYSEEVRLDSIFLENAKNIIVKKEQSIRKIWHKGTSIGSVTGKLEAIDAIDNKNEFIIIPSYGAKSISCKFTPDMLDKMSNFLFKKVKVYGILHYNEESPFPVIVYAESICFFPNKETVGKSFYEMRGMFANNEKPKIEWDELIGD